jgi:toxin-antitoxin system PIN domain toxin
LLAVDVNVLIYAHRREADDHEAYLQWLDRARSGSEPMGVSDVVLNGFVRIVTHPKVFVQPTPVRDALAFARLVRSAPAAIPLAPGARHWSLFEAMCEATSARGNTVPDAWLAALAIEHRATWITADRAFSRFPDLRWRHPLDG